MTIFAFLTVRRSQIYLGCIISALILSLISIFTINPDLYAFIGVLIGTLYLIVDTQLMINKAENGIIEPFEDARQIYYDLFNIFIKIVSLLSKDGKGKKD